MEKKNKVSIIEFVIGLALIIIALIKIFEYDFFILESRNDIQQYGREANNLNIFLPIALLCSALLISGTLLIKNNCIWKLKMPKHTMKEKRNNEVKKLLRNQLSEANQI